MSALEPVQTDELRADLARLVTALRSQIEAAREGARPVALDQPIGRLSRIDALAQQSMTQANRRAAQQRLAHAEAALHRLERGEYGECVACGEDVSFARLKARPETPFCLACQSGRESLRE